MKKRLVILGIGLFMCAGMISGYFIIQAQTKKIQGTEKSPASAVVPEKRTLWDDPAGFTFTYDPSMIIDPHAEDEENYAHIELTKLGETGKIVVWASDTVAQTTSGWVSGQKRFAKASTMDTSFGGQPAIKINATPTTGVMTIGAVYDGLIFSMDAYASESAFLSTEFEKITDSFVFKPIEADQTDLQNTNSNESSFDEEEIVE